MRPRSIQGIADIPEIESHPYDAFMPHQSVFAALQSSADCHPDRRALTFIESADPSVASKSWTHSQFLDQVRRAAQVFTELAGDEAPRVAMLLPAIRRPISRSGALKRRAWPARSTTCWARNTSPS